ncbi:hypothetical protein EDI_329660 [Entamoeba dispar SAW760]|uniref:Uncharacterized protein n=1 Tax=Entamoeba dispar (strain ATCC PRA-260 / SAW760) TaxID=370354 RepID=B0ENG5_ENTDS|nr:uncharacterized protein EDI_329660 [Entamoeba dispar SAW760]EDR23932.1 hypothetical protein EDI_329660 [Entamoeba dispar SAW760]|eukprot:EDR23932.1 hypothetical protein EDI_329660 [Entamoeba dispar SAW760]
MSLLNGYIGKKVIHYNFLICKNCTRKIIEEYEFFYDKQKMNFVLILSMCKKVMNEVILCEDIDIKKQYYLDVLTKRWNIQYLRMKNGINNDVIIGTDIEKFNGIWLFL